MPAQVVEVGRQPGEPGLRTVEFALDQWISSGHLHPVWNGMQFSMMPCATAWPNRPDRLASTLARRRRRE